MLKLFVCITLCGTALTCTAQSITREQLLQERNRLDREISQLQQQLKQVTKGLVQAGSQRQQLEQTIARRSTLIQSINRQASVIDRQMDETATPARITNARLKQLKADYARSIRVAYTGMQNTGMMNFLFSAGSFNNLMRRMQYLRQYRQNRTLQIQQIKQLNSELQQKAFVLALARTDKQQALEQQGAEVRLLNSKKQQLQQAEQQLRQQQQSVKGSIAARQKQRVQIAKEIARIIRRMTHNTDPEPPGDASSPVIKPATASGFLASKGLLNCPVNGYVFAGFGPYTLNGSNAEGYNNFLSLGTSSSGAPVNAVYDGTVKAVNFLPEDNTAIVVVEHEGGYFSCYANLAGVSVTRGQAVTSGMLLGTTGVNEDKPGHGLLEFMMMKGMKTINPAFWVRCRR